jgi:hypothetical protein
MLALGPGLPGPADQAAELGSTESGDLRAERVERKPLGSLRQDQPGNQHCRVASRDNSLAFSQSSLDS